MRLPVDNDFQSETTPLVRIVLESGAVNAAFLFAFVMMLVLNLPSLELVSEMVSPLILLFISSSPAAAEALSDCAPCVRS